MARKEINVFSVSFLDLLSGALAAVIILFIIVPKMTSEQQSVLEQIEGLKTEVVELDSLLAQLHNSIPADEYTKLMDKLDSFQDLIDNLEQHVSSLQAETEKLKAENEELKELIKNCEDSQKTIEQLRSKIAELEKEVKEKSNDSKMANTVEKTLGVFAQFGILCRWTEANTDVDIGVQRFGSSPEQCWRMYPNKEWGILGEDVRERNVGEEERFELFYVPQIYEDDYTFWINIYEKSASFDANVMCVLIFHPGKPDEIRKEIGPIHLTNSSINCVVSFHLNKYGFNIINYREPQWGEGRVVK
ncbi:MAG: hypothetical protein PHU62_05720 [Bacteroidales bacterium]|jgi:regulator of replication initiation timing|nr:hypothetical protein [Bacteroidales bacterium]MDD2205436.1 hypothetical protein [Bacteroidales bacterium]MDD3914100.1 hypothetical protein [Bacteroidales bacterium]MDD4634052.1 hypothetical protein [Bacteroidales bacterium]